MIKNHGLYPFYISYLEYKKELDKISDGEYRDWETRIDYRDWETFNCGSGFTDEDRKEIWNNKEKYLGKIAEIQYFRESHNQDGGLSVS